jgi:hypothetical protein
VTDKMLNVSFRGFRVPRKKALFIVLARILILLIRRHCSSHLLSSGTFLIISYRYCHHQTMAHLVVSSDF